MRSSLGLFILLVVCLGLAPAVQADAPATYCEFPTDLNPDLSWLCNSSSIGIAGVTNTSPSAMSIKFTTSNSLPAALASSFQFEAVLTASKVMENGALSSDGDAAGVLKRIIVPGTNSTTHQSIQFDPGFNTPFYIFYRLRYFEDGTAKYSTPWKVYSSVEGTPIGKCSSIKCNPETFSIQTGPDEWFSRLGVSQSDANHYSVMIDGNQVDLATNGCATSPQVAYANLRNASNSCYLENAKLIFMSFSQSTIGIVFDNGFPRPVAGSNSNAEKRMNSLLPVTGNAARSYHAAIVDRVASIDNLNDIVANINFRYGTFNSETDLLDIAVDSISGIRSRNTEWLLPSFKVNADLQKTNTITLGMLKRQPLNFYYLGRNVSNIDSSVFQRDSFPISILVTNSLNLFVRSDSGKSKQIDVVNSGANFSSKSDTFNFLRKNGLWIGMYDRQAAQSFSSGCVGANVSINGTQIGIVAIDPETNLLSESVEGRTGDFETVAGTSDDPLKFQSVFDTLNIHAGTIRRLNYDSFVLRDFIGAKISGGRIHDFAKDGKGLFLKTDTSGMKGEIFSTIVDLPRSARQDDIALEFIGRNLTGVHYVLVGLDKRRDDGFLIKSRLASRLKSRSILINGVEPHFIESRTRGSNFSPVGIFNFPRGVDSSNFGTDGKRIYFDVWGISNKKILSCIDGYPYSEEVTQRLDCGTPSTFPIAQIAGISYFGHGVGNSLVGVGQYLLTSDWRGRGPGYTNWNQCNGSIDSANKCWPYYDATKLISFKSGDTFYNKNANLFTKDAEFTGYACQIGLPHLGSSLISRVASLWHITAKGDSQIIVLQCLGPSGSIGACKLGELKYYNLNPKVERELFDSVGRVFTALQSAVNELSSYEFPGTLKVDTSLWIHANMKVCKYNSTDGSVDCSAIERISPDYFDVVERK